MKTLWLKFTTYAELFSFESDIQEWCNINECKYILLSTAYGEDNCYTIKMKLTGSEDDFLHFSLKFSQYII